MSRERDSQRRWARGWHAGFFLHLWGATAASVASTGWSDAPMSTADHLTLLVAVVGISAWYMLAWPAEPASARRLALVIWGTALATLAVSWKSGFFSAPAAFLIAHFMTWLPQRWAMVSVAVLGLAIGARFIEYLGLFALALGGGAAASAIFLGLYIESIVRQSEQRRALIAELNATRAQLAAAERLSGAAIERARMAREVHDTVIQDLISVVRLVESARRTMARSPADADGYLQLSERAARAGLEEARRLVNATRPALDEPSLPTAIQRACARFTQESGVPAEVVVASDLGALAPELEVAALRITQEALANVRKHARASAVRVTIARISDQIALDIHDDGIGFDPSAPLEPKASAGFGLVGLRERIKALGGELDVQSVRGEGTTVSVQLPIPGSGATDESAARTPAEAHP